MIEVTEACNHDCVHCYNFWRDRRLAVHAPQTLSRQQILALVEKVRRDTPLRQVGLSGGEPLLRTDLPEIVQDLAGEGLNVVVITNATLMTDDLAVRFPLGTIFEFTLFSSNAQVHDLIAGRVGAFQKVLAGVACAGHHHHRLALSCVVNRLNANDVNQTIELGIALGADTVLLNRINLSHLTAPRVAELVPSLKGLQGALTGADKAAERYGIDVAVSVPIPPCLVDISAYPHLHFGWCPRGAKEAYYTISHDGLLRPCNHSSAILGDLKTDSFGEIVLRRKTSAFWNPVPKPCRSCKHPLADLCRGGCPAASDECYHSRNCIDPFVNAVREQSTRTNDLSSE